MTAETELVVAELGARGDGVAATRAGPVYVPFALPGERIRARVAGSRAALIEVVEPSPDRQAPVCGHFGTCGGCALQHMRGDACLGWKRRQVAAAFARRGIAAPVAEVVPVPAGARRRAVLTAMRTARGAALGYRRRLSHHIVDIAECPVLRPAIVGALPDLRALADALLPRRAEMRLTVLDTDTGLDVSVDGARAMRDSGIPARMATLAAGLDLARLTVDGETLVMRRHPMLPMGPARVAPPPGAFVQATAEAERHLTARVLEGVAGTGRVADLFCGLGTFALPLAAGAEVLAADLDAGLLASLDRAARAPGLKPVRTMRRDLFREPLSPRELDGFGAVVFDPPRAGAAAQAAEIARSRVPRVVAVSCDPATLARDARILMDGGYRLASVEPVDQFLHSPHVEAVAVLAR